MSEGELVLDFGEAIEKMIKDKGTSKKALSLKSGISRQLIIKYTNGQVFPTARNLCRLMDAMNCTLKDLAKAMEA